MCQTYIGNTNVVGENSRPGPAGLSGLNIVPVVLLLTFMVLADPRTANRLL